jgi:drug/metabolite transporter (DMT)-like permease
MSTGTVDRAAANASSTESTSPVVRARMNMVGIVLSVVGGVGVMSAIAAQAFAIDHGSNQKPIDANNITTVWSIIIGACLLALGVVLWFSFQSGGEYKYLYVYGLAFSSYIVATIALYMSTIQVIVRESTN